MKQQDNLFWIWLSETLGVANKDFTRLIQLYRTPYEIFNAEESELERVPEISEKTLTRLMDKSLQHASEILENCEKQGIGILTHYDEAFPPQLREIQRPPVLLYYKGNMMDLGKSLTVGMVGTRRMSAYGLQNAYRIAYELSLAGAVVVSGMATGIDGVCAAAALKAKCTTVAVLGCGLDLTYPRHHRPLMAEIAKQGILLSEYPPGTPPSSYHFPMRNRIISGISRTTVVVEAGLGSGSLITAKDAVSQGRMVFAVPANVGAPGAEGTNGLLRDGARAATGAKDILQPFLYEFDEVLRPERLLKLSEDDSTADLEYLDRLGIIELVNRQETQEVKQHPEASESKTDRRKQPKKPRRTPQEDARKESSPKVSSHESELEKLTPIQLAVLRAVPDDRAFSTDALRGLDYPYGEMIAALTMLELMGLVQKLSGGLYTKF